MHSLAAKPGYVLPAHTWQSTKACRLRVVQLKSKENVITQLIAKGKLRFLFICDSWPWRDSSAVAVV